MKLVTVSEMQQVERQADASGLTYAQMMENAGSGVSKQVQQAALQRSLVEKTILALVGPGNNGGDALVALADLAANGWQVSAYIVRPRPEDDPLVERVTSAGGTVQSRSSDRNFQRLETLLRSHAVLLDGVLGTGMHLPLKKEIAETLGFVKKTLEGMDLPPFVVAVDCPSGVDCDSGEAVPECLRADLTVTMAAVKQGLLRLPAYALAGELRLALIGDLDSLPAWQEVYRQVVDHAWVRSILPSRPLDAHKGTFGTALVVAGSVNYTGAAWLAGQAAYRCGVGLVTLAVPTPLHTALAGQFPEATWLLLPHELGVISVDAVHVVKENLGRATAMLVGPGFGLEETTGRFVEELFASETASRKTIGFAYPAMQAKAKEDITLPPMVVDADGLKLLARLPDWPGRLPGPAVLTPHPGEMSILTGQPVDEINTDRFGTAERYARQWGHVVVLKGAFTVIASPQGDSAVVPVASPALARAGTGDVLAGLITGLRAQGVPPFEAAVAGAWLHAQAGLEAARNLGSTTAVLAGDVLHAVPAVLSSFHR